MTPTRHFSNVCTVFITEFWLYLLGGGCGSTDKKKTNILLRTVSRLSKIKQKISSVIRNTMTTCQKNRRFIYPQNTTDFQACSFRQVGSMDECVACKVFGVWFNGFRVLTNFSDPYSWLYCVFPFKKKAEKLGRLTHGESWFSEPENPQWKTLWMLGVFPDTDGSGHVVFQQQTGLISAPL
jgi:hypothetical protein